ncbi:hypothetical protein N7478_009217 [Penicillium angulare]|uniref:uncharacterized protein n=1 Tax=Penicillium angulare TaxID=116970 RepID=UPI002541029D|nr:uncharacterized protein N7478_009217 [Penicillium angulare]KAJ5274092.1 hypothetical protein N7478_009217 [Penicillium angulare]
MEILIHVSAPSTVQDDARYRAQVDAIVACQSNQYWRTIQPASSSSTAAVETCESPRQSTVDSVLIKPRGQESPAPRSDHQPARPLSGQTLCAQPIATRIGSSPPAPLDRVYHPVPDSLDSLVSVIPDSQPETDLDPIHSIRSLDSCPLDTREISLEDSYSNPPSKKCRIGPLLLPLTSTVSPSATITHGPANTPTLVNPVSSTSHSHFPCPRKILGNIPHLQEPCHLLPFLPLEIRPAPPPISTATFVTHITPTLSMLTERLKPARTYKPLHQSRSLDPLERGYWSTNMVLWPDKKGPGHDHHWDVSTFHRFWSFLSDFIGKDSRAGWGVWCILEYTDLSPSFLGGVSVHDANEMVLVQLKVYAWGEIAMHIYLLLFLASERRVRGMGLQWRDSRDETVVQMP